MLPPRDCGAQDLPRAPPPQKWPTTRDAATVNKTVAADETTRGTPGFHGRHTYVNLGQPAKRRQRRLRYGRGHQRWAHWPSCRRWQDEDGDVTQEEPARGAASMRSSLPGGRKDASVGMEPSFHRADASAADKEISVFLNGKMKRKIVFLEAPCCRRCRPRCAGL